VTLYLGILLALGCALGTNLGFLYKFRGANDVPAVSVRHPLGSARALFGSRWFTLGCVVAVPAWALHVAALAVAPMTVVQVVLAAGVVALAVMADRLFGWHVGRRQFWGVVLVAVGLVLIAVTLPHPVGAHSAFSVAGMTAFEAGFLGLGAVLMIGPRLGGRREHHGIMLGAASGLLFGVSDVATKAITGLVLHQGIPGFATPWLGVALIAAVLAFYSSARGFQQGEPVPIITVCGASANLAGIAGGIIVFGDPLAQDPLGIALEALAFAMVLVASALSPAPLRAGRVAGAPATL
jgi:small basic protein